MRGRVTIQKRSLIVGLLLAFALILYGAAKYYSPTLIFYVVEQSLIQKAPSGIDPARLHARLSELIAKDPDHMAQMRRLLHISQYLEKIQHLTLEDLDKILAPESL
jgi:hypothetical protein